MVVGDLEQSELSFPELQPLSSLLEGAGVVARAKVEVDAVAKEMVTLLAPFRSRDIASSM